MKKILLFASIAAIFASCSSSQPKFELEVNIHNNASLLNKKFIVTQIIDGSVVHTDTFKIKKDNFLLSIPYEGPAVLNISIMQSNVDRIMMAAEEGKIILDIDGVKPDISGTPINNRLQAYYNESDSVSLLFQQLDKEYELLSAEGRPTPAVREEFRLKRAQLLKENTDRIIAFIKENIDNQIGEYFFRSHYITFIVERKLELNSFATEKLKKEFGIP